MKTLLRPKAVKLLEPLETIEQQIFMNLVHAHVRQHPELALMFAVPNGARTGMRQAIKLHREGMRAGIPDICLPIARGGYVGWWGELKRKKTGYLSTQQKEIISALRVQGHWACWHRGADEMFADLLWYLSLPHTVIFSNVKGYRPERARRPIYAQTEGAE